MLSHSGCYPRQFRMHLPVLWEKNGAFSCRMQTFPKRNRTLPHVNKNSDMDPYGKRTFEFDIDPFSTSPHPQPVCLPSLWSTEQESLLGRKRLLLESGTRYFLNSLFSSRKFCKPVDSNLFPQYLKCQISLCN